MDFNRILEFVYSKDLTRERAVIKKADPGCFSLHSLRASFSSALKFLLLGLSTSLIDSYMPQIQENYALQSGEGLSIFFVFIWLLGDLANVSSILFFC